MNPEVLLAASGDDLENTNLLSLFHHGLNCLNVLEHKQPQGWRKAESTQLTTVQVAAEMRVYLLILFLYLLCSTSSLFLTSV